MVELLSSTFLYALDNTVTVNIHPDIIEPFDRIRGLAWLSVSSPMGEVGFNPLRFVILPKHGLCGISKFVSSRGNLNSQFNSKYIYLAAVHVVIRVFV